MKNTQKISEIQGQTEAIIQLRSFIDNFSIQSKKGALLHGPSGCGKTSVVYALASLLGSEIIELNSSDFRSKDRINKIMKEAIMQKSLFYKSKIILIDEIDSLSGRKDRGGAEAVIKLLEITKFPIFLTANDVWNKKLNKLRPKTILVKFDPLSSESMLNILKKTCEKENIKADEFILNEIVEKTDGDARAAVSDLQAVSAGRKIISKGDCIADKRRKDKTIFEALYTIMRGEEADINAFESVDRDLDECFLWLDENIPLEFDKEDLEGAYNALSKADIFRRRIRRWQHWRFLVYVNALLTAGVNASRKYKSNKYVSYKRPSRILKIWLANRKNAKNKAIAEKLAKATHCSKKRALKEIVFLKMIFKNNQERNIPQELNLEEDEVVYLKQ